MVQTLFVRDIPSPPVERVPIWDLRRHADIAKARYENALDEIFACTREAHRHGHSGRSCAACADGRLLRLEWLTAERLWVRARQEAGVIENSLYVEFDARETAELIRRQPTCAA
jgi:hypothetical protein